MNGAWRAGRRELHDTASVPAQEVGVEPPTELPVKELGAIDVRHRNDDDLELHVDRLGAGCSRCVVATNLGAAHDGLPVGCRSAFLASSARLSPSMRLNAGNGWITS